LNVLGALHGVDHRGEVHREAIPDGFDDPPVMLGYGLADELIMPLQ